MFQKLLLSIFVAIVGLIWYRFLTKKDTNKLDSTKSDKSSKFNDSKNKENIEMLEPCSKCGIYFTSNSSETICQNCRSE